MLNGSLDKTHGAPSHRSTEVGYLDSICLKDPIAWPIMTQSEKWQQLDDDISALLVGHSAICERLNLLEDTIYSQASLLFGHAPPPKKV